MGNELDSGIAVLGMSNIRRVQATNPHTGAVVDRQSKTKVYTHALVVHQSAQEAYTIPAGTYTVPAARLRGFNRKAYQQTLSRDYVSSARKASSAIWSFHTSFDAAFKAGNTERNRSLKNSAEEKATYGHLVDNERPLIERFEVVEVEVIDEGFNA
jgi:hypothetical protein